MNVHLVYGGEFECLARWSQLRVLPQHAAATGQWPVPVTMPAQSTSIAHGDMTREAPAGRRRLLQAVQRLRLCHPFGGGVVPAGVAWSSARCCCLVSLWWRAWEAQLHGACAPVCTPCCGAHSRRAMRRHAQALLVEPPFGIDAWQLQMAVDSDLEDATFAHGVTTARPCAHWRPVSARHRADGSPFRRC